MKMYYDTEDNGHCVIILDKKESQDLATALTVATEPKSCKPLSKRSRAWKLAYKIADHLPCW